MGGERGLSVAEVMFDVRPEACKGKKGRGEKRILGSRLSKG